jgi:signal transduction histidine kinase
MNNGRPSEDVLRLIRFASLLWLAYLIILIVIGRSFHEPQYTNPLYYILLGLIVLLCFILSYWTWIQRLLRQAFLPLIIAIITITPIIINQFTPQLLPLGPRFSDPEGNVLAIFPFLLVGFLLVAWQYRWQYILFIILGITGLNLAVIWSTVGFGTPPSQGALAITLIQTVILLAVGFSISYLMSRLREKQQSLESANMRLTHYASTLEHLATSRERNRLARELHDTLAHTLSGLSVQLETIKAYWDVDPQAARSMLTESLYATHAGLEETRRALKALRATPLEDMGLALAIDAMVKDVTARANLNLRLSIADGLPVLSPDVEQCIYRVAQEAVTNIVNHAQAKNLVLELKPAGERVELTVSDDGIGFDVEKSLKTSRFGLVGMQERAQLVGGELHITSRPGHGTKLRLII